MHSSACAVPKPHSVNRSARELAEFGIRVEHGGSLGDFARVGATWIKGLSNQRIGRPVMMAGESTRLFFLTLMILPLVGASSTGRYLDVPFTPHVSWTCDPFPTHDVLSQRGSAAASLLGQGFAGVFTGDFPAGLLSVRLRCEGRTPSQSNIMFFISVLLR